MTVKIHHGDCLDVLRAMPDNSVEAIVTDPPYGLSNTSPDKVADAIVRWASGDREYMPAGRGFMGSAWDAFVPPPAVWDECFRVLTPGGHLVAFAGDRTQDLMGISIRLSGMELRSSIAYMFGSGFPKSHDVGKSTGDPRFKGVGTALKPAHEPIILARKPIQGTVAANVQEHGTGALNIDATRIGTPSEVKRQVRPTDGDREGWGMKAHTPYHYPPGGGGRWPANVILDEDQAAALDEQSGPVGSNSGTPTKSDGTRNSGGMYSPGTTGTAQTWEKRGGGASRFFKVVEPDPPFMYAAKAPKRERPRYEDADGNVIQHPTCKPLSIMRWLAKLTCPPGGVILDPFTGSGTTIEAAMLEGFDVIGIEREAAYLPLIQQRIDRATPTDPGPADDLLGLLDGAA